MISPDTSMGTRTCLTHARGSVSGRFIAPSSITSAYAVNAAMQPGGLTYKKTAHAAEQRRQARQAWFDGQLI